MSATATCPLTRDAAEALAADLVADMTRRWREGERPLPEEYLARHQELQDHPEAAADLIYEELCLREEYGPEASVEQVLERFPQWRPQLELLLDCQRLLSPRRPTLRFPLAGESLGDFLLLTELGRGVHGRVFLASQLSLGDRPVVLKLSPLDAGEHLSLARLQHTNIVPLYSVQDHADRGLRALCMPYFGGATLARLLDGLRPTLLANRTADDLRNVLARSQSNSVECSMFGIRRPHIENVTSSSSAGLAGASYTPAVCRIGACLADALQYAHDRGLVHLDLKPSNVLVTADGQPMVLDFHLAREPISPDDPAPTWLGGTPGYMSPEQAAALRAVQLGRSVSAAVDGRSDLFSLGVMLYEALAGDLPWPLARPEELTTIQADGKSPEGDTKYNALPDVRPAPLPLHVRNPQVSLGLSDIVRKCLAADPADRYQSMAALATDLRRHLADLPLAGVRNRSLPERWHKWRRRRPHGVALTGMMGAVLAATCAVGVGLVNHVGDRIHQARAALVDGRVQMAKGEWELAAGTLRRGLVALENLPWQGELAGDLERGIARANDGRVAADRATLAADLHRLADQARFLYTADHIPRVGRSELAAGCRAFWAHRDRVIERLCSTGSRTLDTDGRNDLIDLAICCANADADPRAVLDQAEALVGPSVVLNVERRLSAGADLNPLPGRAQTCWEHYALGRAHLRAGQLQQATAETDAAVRMQPQGLWPNYYKGVCAYRQGRLWEAAAAFGVCIGAAPDAVGYYVNRGLAFAGLGKNEEAIGDYQRALLLDSKLVIPTLERLKTRPADKSESPAPAVPR